MTITLWRLPRLIIGIFCAFILALSSLTIAQASDNNLIPKYGLQPKSESEKAADSQFIARMEKHFDGDRVKAAQAVAKRGWDFFRDGDISTAIKRFNQAWLLDPKNVQALWGMGAISSGSDLKTALSLFLEAEAIDDSDIDLNVDCTRTMSLLAARDKDFAMMKDAMTRFERISRRAPLHAMNWQNWAVALYYTGDYAGAWEKIKVVENRGASARLDPGFIEALTQKMPRPAVQ